MIKCFYYCCIKRLIFVHFVLKRCTFSFRDYKNKKKYRAIFFQTLQKSDILKIDSEIKSKITEICVEKGERAILEKECNKFLIKYILGLLLKKSVKIAISESNGQYYITMYYDNKYNQTNGEDL